MDSQVVDGVVYPKHPVSAYLFYAADRRPELKKENPNLSFGELTRTIAKEWEKSSHAIREPYIQKAQKDKERYYREKGLTEERELEINEVLAKYALPAPLVEYKMGLGSTSSEEIKACFDKSSKIVKPYGENNDLDDTIDADIFLEHLVDIIKSDPEILSNIMKVGKFFATKHNIHDKIEEDPQHECDDCYSGDTEFEYNDCLNDFGKILGKTYKDLIIPFSDDENNEDE
jgi:high mobility group protein B1